MDSNKVDYSDRTKETVNNDKISVNTTKASTKYVFRPEIVKSMPKSSHQNTTTLEQSRKSSANGLRELFERVTRNSSDNKSSEKRDIDERTRSRSLFLAHDHSKDSVKNTEQQRDCRIDRRNNKHQSEHKCRKNHIDVRLRTCQDIEENQEQKCLSNSKSGNLSKNRNSHEHHERNRQLSPEHLETCQEEEYRENGKICRSSISSRLYDDRHDHTTRPNETRWSHLEKPVIQDDHQQTNRRNHDEVIDRVFCTPRHSTKYSFGSESQWPHCNRQQSSVETNSQQTYDTNERVKHENVRLLRRVDSPYPCTINHSRCLSTSRDVTSIDATRGESSMCRLNQDDHSKISPVYSNCNKASKTQKTCENCGKPHSRSNNHSNDYSIIEDHERPMIEVSQEEEENKAKIKKIYDFEKKIENNGKSGVVLYRSRSLPQLSVHDSGVASGNEQIPGRPTSRLVADLRQLLTLKQHYYPEGGWGWVIVVVGVLVQIISHGLHGSAGIIVPQVQIRFETPVYLQSGWLGAMSTGVALLVSPVTIAFCRKKSTRVTAVLGGLVTALGCLFTSFASQFHQLFFSYGTVVGIGVGMTRDCSTLMVAQYFKRRREFVEIFIVSGSGLGIAVMSAFIKGAISKIGWRLGLQAVTVVVFLTFILGTFYRSASLYHPQRRAILHLKNQKRKIKDKNRLDDRPPFFDFSTLKSKTVRILLVSTGISAFGINTPIFYLAHQAEEEGLGDTVILLQTYLGLAWTLGCVAFGLLVVHHSVECRIARQYLTQAAVFMCGLCILALTAVHGNYHGYVMFTWIYGIFCGGYHYSLKMYTYERVRARNFARTWGFVQCSQAIPIAIGVPISGYMNVGCGGKAGYYFSSTCVLVGSFTLFFIDLHRRNLSRHKHTRANGTRHLCVTENCPQRRRLSFTQDPENEGVAAGAAAAALVLGAELAPGQGEIIDALGADKPELTCISEEGIADMDLPDNLLDDLDYIGDCITSCNKVENYLMLSEFENNLIAEMPIIMDRKGRRWSLARSKPPLAQVSSHQHHNDNGNENNDNVNGHGTNHEDDDETKLKWHLAPVPPNNRTITVIEEGST